MRSKCFQKKLNYGLISALILVKILIELSAIKYILLRPFRYNMPLRYINVRQKRFSLFHRMSCVFGHIQNNDMLVRFNFISYEVLPAVESRVDLSASAMFMYGSHENWRSVSKRRM